MTSIIMSDALHHRNPDSMGCVRRRFQASFSFLQDADDLFFGESLFHCRSSLERTLHRHSTQRGEQVNSDRSHQM